MTVFPKTWMFSTGVPWLYAAITIPHPLLLLIIRLSLTTSFLAP